MTVYIKYLKNVHFFNSDSILFSINKKNFYTDRFGIGIHITNQAVEHIKYAPRYNKSDFFSYEYERSMKCLNYWIQKVYFMNMCFFTSR